MSTSDFATVIRRGQGDQPVLDLSPDGALVVSAGGTAKLLQVFDVQSGLLRFSHEAKESCCRATFLSNDTLLFVESDKVFTHVLSTGNTRQVGSLGGGAAGWGVITGAPIVRTSPERDRVFVTFPSKPNWPTRAPLEVRSSKDYSLLGSVAPLPGQFLCDATFNPTGDELAITYCSETTTLSVLYSIGSQGLTETSRVTYSAKWGTSGAFVHKDRMVFAAGSDLLVVDRKNGSWVESKRHRIFAGQLRGLTVSADRKWLAAYGTVENLISSDTIVPGVHLVDTDTFQVKATTPSRKGGLFESVAISRDGKWLAAEAITLWAMPTLDFVNDIDVHTSSFPNHVNFSPHGEMLELHTRFGQRIIDLSTLTEVMSLRSSSRGTVDWQRKELVYTEWRNRVPYLVARSFSGSERTLLSHPRLSWEMFAGPNTMAFSDFSPAPLALFARGSDGSAKFLGQGKFGTYGVKDVIAAQSLGRVYMRDIGHTTAIIDTQKLSLISTIPKTQYLAMSGDEHFLFTADGTQVTKRSMDGVPISTVEVGGFVTSLTAANNGHSVAGILINNQTFVLDGTTMKPVTLIPDGAMTRCLALHPTQKQVAICHDDGTITVWSYASAPSSPAQELYRIITGGDGELAFLLADGTYSASRKGAQLLSFKREGKLQSLSSYDLALNRPDLVVERTGYPANGAMYRAARARRLQKLGLDESLVSVNAPLPQVGLNTTEVPLATDAEAISFEAQASDTKALAALTVSVNGVPLEKAEGYLLADKPTATKRSFRVPLSAGRNRIEVSALSTSGLESSRERFFVTKRGTAKTRTFVVALGVSAYAQKEFNLAYAAKDAEDVAASFSTRGATPQTTLVLTDKEVTRAALPKIRSFLKQTTVDDRVIIFVAGHGVLDDKLDYYFATSDIDFAKPAERGLGYSALEDLFDGLAARQRLLMMDTCHSGDLDDSSSAVALAPAAGVKARSISKRGLKVVGSGAKGGQTGAIAKALFSDLKRSTGAVVLASAGAREFALETSALKNGVFTSVLKQTLKERPSLPVSELMTTVGGKVTELTGGGQTPTTRRDAAEFDFSL